MANSGTFYKYDDPNFQIIREQRYIAVQSPSASLSDFAVFRCRNRCIVNTVVVHCASLPSAATTWSLQVMRGASTIAAKTVSSFSVVADLSAVITLTSSNTLETITDSINLELDTTEKGKFHVIYEYQLLPPASI
jgi:hypothetical protein